MNYITPEKAGISSKQIEKFIKYLEDKRLSTHNMILAKGNDIFFEAYWQPFNKDFLHRLYSVTKSIVSIAIGFCEQDGLVALDAPISKYFPAEAALCKDENLKNQTVRHMLMMATAKPCMDWFSARTDDRVRFYFENTNKSSRPSGTIFEYDSSGSFVLCALVERVTGKDFTEYLREKLFDEIGISRETYCLKCPGGHSWGDSGMIMKPADLLKIARFMLNGGSWNGKQILNKEYVTAAISKQIDNNECGENEYDNQGYGYQIWRNLRNSFSFNGMGCQFAVCVPHLDLIFIYNGDNQGKVYSKHDIMEGFFGLIVDQMADSSLPENQADYTALQEYAKTLKLAAAIGEKASPFAEQINGKTYKLGPNPTTITELKLTFEGDKGRLEYKNWQGEKCLPFGICKNEFCLFPEEGYSNEIGSVATKDFYYKSAVSAAWIEEKKLFIKVQAIDTYFGTLDIILSFTDDGRVAVKMSKCAEDFFHNYQGYAEGKQE